jgi:ketosteroid isomerase-like protein
MVPPMTDEHSSALRRTDNYLTSVGMDHVRLSYSYLDDGDVDAYCSLFTEQAVLRQPGKNPVNGRDELERHERARQASRSVRHSIVDVFGSGRKVAAVGRMSHHHSPATDHDTHFVDVFTVGDSGLLENRTTFLFTPGRCMETT